MQDPAIFLGLDAVSAVLGLLVAAAFARLAARTRDSMHALLAAGFALVSVSFVSVSTSEFNTFAPLPSWDGLRVAGQLGGALVLMFAYVSHRVHGSPRPWLVVGWTAAALSAVAAALFWAVSPFAALPGLEATFPLAHAVEAAAYGACAALALQGLLRRPSADRALVPIAFCAWAASKYTWLLIDLSSARSLIPLVYVWRFAAVALFLLALWLPARPREVAPRASP